MHAVNVSRYSKLTVGNCSFALTIANDHFISTDGDICEIKNIISHKGAVSVLCHKYAVKDNFFYYPLDSSYLGIYKVSRLMSGLFQI